MMHDIRDLRLVLAYSPHTLTPTFGKAIHRSRELKSTYKYFMVNFDEAIHYCKLSTIHLLQHLQYANLTRHD